ncbi:PREDICTED: uncharacterized protein LOC104709598 [Camelina sativa]|uniref:S-protein homolog n=1 Tax=Camelina sativa TaxID=90675 RepID=A0ABM1QD74_CAMSA|nr:PREDICTED: uncharacterized protein LOC104709598 [Camelina sativa]
MVNSSGINLNSYFCSIFTMIIVMIPLIHSEALQILQAKDSFRSHLTRITIQNDNDYLLGIHCKFRDEDIGFHILGTGELLAWKFHVNYYLSTLYFCGFSQRQINKGVFTIYKASRDFYRCANCKQRKMVFMDIMIFLKRVL